jgi:hypothetical protein
MRRCSNCDAKARPRGTECVACSVYRSRNGTARPPHTYAALGTRRLTERKAVRSLNFETWDPEIQTLTLEEWRRRESA